MSLTTALQYLETAHVENARLFQENARLRAEVERLHGQLDAIAKRLVDWMDATDEPIAPEALLAFMADAARPGALAQGDGAS